MKIRFLRKEATLNKQVIAILANEVTELKSRCDIFEKSMLEFQNNSRLIFQAEMDNLQKSFQVLKSFYNEELHNSRHVIENLSITIDDILLNLKKEKPDSMILKKLYKNHAENIIENHMKDKNMKGYADMFLKEGGVATKKLDYILFDLKSKENLDVVFGSGLTHQVPSKCPLYKNLKFTMKGDDCSGLYTPHTTD